MEFRHKLEPRVNMAMDHLSFSIILAAQVESLREKKMLSAAGEIFPSGHGKPWRNPTIFIQFLQDFVVVWCWLPRIVALWSFTKIPLKVSRNPTELSNPTVFISFYQFLLAIPSGFLQDPSRSFRNPQGPKFFTAMAALLCPGRTWRGGWRWNRSAVPRRCASRSMRRSDASRRRPD